MAGGNNEKEVRCEFVSLHHFMKPVPNETHGPSHSRGAGGLLLEWQTR